MKEQHGQKSRVSLPQVDLTKKEERVTKERIQDLTLKHQAKRLEIPEGHHSVLE